MPNFQNQTDRLQNRTQRLQERSQTLSSYRVLAFSVSAAWGLAMGYFFPSPLWQIPTILGFLAFAFLVLQQDKVDRSLEKFQKRWEFSRRTLAVATLDWTLIPPLPSVTGVEKLPRYFSDLDFFAGKAVLRLINQTVSTAGYQALVKHFLIRGITVDQLSQRQETAKEAQKLRLLRREFFVVASLWAGMIESDRVADLLEKPLHTAKAVRGFWFLFALQSVFIGLFIFFSLAGGTPFFLAAGLALSLAYKVFGKEIEIFGAYGYGMSLDTSLGKFSALASVIEKMSRTKAPHLNQLLAPFAGDKNPSVVLARAGRVVGFLGVKQNPILHLAINLVFPWDFYWTLRLEKMRIEVKDRLPTWMQTLAQLEIYLSLAEFQETHAHFPFPQVHARADFSLKCKKLGHPLIPAASRVGNDLVLNPEQRCVIITGSNMSGKSTFLRSLGVNLLLAEAGTVVCAESLDFTALDLATSLRLNDSLEEGLSSFYAEVRQLRNILDDATSGRPVFYLIDEVFRGTNNRERLIGSRAFVKHLAKTQAVGLITTHDLELSQLAEENPGIKNFHFKEDIDGDRMSFSYHLAEGPCPTTNALKVMQLAGLPITEIS